MDIANMYQPRFLRSRPASDMTKKGDKIKDGYFP